MRQSVESASTALGLRRTYLGGRDATEADRGDTSTTLRPTARGRTGWGVPQRWQTRVVDRYPRRDQDPRLKLSDRCQYRPQRCAALPAVRRLTATLRVARVQAPPHPRLR